MKEIAVLIIDGGGESLTFEFISSQDVYFITLPTLFAVSEGMLYTSIHQNIPLKDKSNELETLRAAQKCWMTVACLKKYLYMVS